MTTTPVPPEQRDVAVQFVHVVAQSWSKNFTDDLANFNNLRDRLEGVVHTVLVQLSGNGGVDAFRLTPKSQPELDLFDLDWSLQHAYPLDDSASGTPDPDGPPAAVELLRAIYRCQLAIEGAPSVSPAESVHRFLAGICRILEEGYLLVSLYFDEEGQFESEGRNVAPGLTVAFETVWAEAAK